MSNHRIPEATVSRLPRYLQVLIAAAEAGDVTMASSRLARVAGLNAAIVRKDLSHIDVVGTRGVGYDVDDLVGKISTVLGLHVDQVAVIVGIGNLGRALATYHGFEQRGFSVAALVDADPDKVGQLVGGQAIQPIADLERIVATNGVTIAVLAVPGPHAQSVADRLVDSGVGAILNFAPVHLDLPASVVVRHVDLSTELQILSFYQRGTAVEAALDTA